MINIGGSGPGHAKALGQETREHEPGASAGKNTGK